jgi:lipocalin
MKSRGLQGLIALASAGWALTAPAQVQSVPLVALASLEVPGYMGTWYQVA